MSRRRTWRAGLAWDCAAVQTRDKPGEIENITVKNLVQYDEWLALARDPERDAVPRGQREEGAQVVARRRRVGIAQEDERVESLHTRSAQVSFGS